ncbi:MAG: type II secretion system F family protein [Planctomycetota bacterium]|jgi:type IV pilus assembly protein PilC
MPLFQYTALDERGQDAQGEIEALSCKEAVSKIRNKGLYPSKVRPRKASKKIAPAQSAMADRDRRRTCGKVKPKRLAQFARQMSTLQDAGLAILRSLRILEKQQKSAPFKRVIGYVADDIEGGATLSEAMRKHPNCFSGLFVNMVAAGEVGGVLDVILMRVADFMERSQRLKSKIKGAMVYPVAVLTAAFFIVMGLMTFVIPMFSETLIDLTDGQGKMPALTQVLIDASAWLRGRYGMNALMVFLTPFVLTGIIKLIRKFSSGRYAMDWLKLHIPIVRGLVYKTTVARWSRTLATLINAGVPILDSIRITGATSGNEVYAAMLNNVQKSIRQGDTFARPLAMSGTVDDIVVNMIDVGEETGDLDKMLIKVADNFDEEAEVMIRC